MNSEDPSWLSRLLKEVPVQVPSNAFHLWEGAAIMAGVIAGITAFSHSPIVTGICVALWLGSTLVARIRRPKDTASELLPKWVEAKAQGDAQLQEWTHDELAAVMRAAAKSRDLRKWNLRTAYLDKLAEAVGRKLSEQDARLFASAKPLS